MHKQNLVIAGVSSLLLIGGGLLLNNAVLSNSRHLDDQVTATVNEKTVADSSDVVGAVDTEEKTPVAENGAKRTETQLLYLIEEEKLAHDVYTVMYDKYGARVFGNILKSESTHQGRVLTLLEIRNIADPRSSEIGVFTNTELQSLYNALIAKGSKSATDAYEVGVIIEEKDIADISTQLATTSDVDVISVLEDLRSGSENHLRAFNKQL